MAEAKAERPTGAPAKGQGHRLRRTTILVYGTLLVAALLMPDDIDYWIGGFTPDALTATASDALQPLIAAADAIGVTTLRQNLHDAFRTFTAMAF